MSPAFARFAAFLVSFCSLGYELLLARTFADLGQDEVLSQCLTIGVYLLGLGLGSALVAQRNFAHPLRTLFWVELALSGCGALSIPLIYFSLIFVKAFYFPQFQLWTQSGPAFLILAFQPLTLIIGVLSGFELPLLIRQGREPLRARESVLLAFSYFGGLVAGLILPLFVFVDLDVAAAGVVLSLVNLLCVFALFRPAGFTLFRPSGAILIVPVALIWAASQMGPVAIAAFLKVHYLEISQQHLNLPSLRNLIKALSAVGPVHRIRSPYQAIDIVDENIWRNFGEKSEFTLYLNRHPQFSRDTIASYHQGMVHGALNLAGRIPRRVLILGGGDGFLARELLRYPEVEKITIVELDATVVEICSTHPVIRDLNGDALRSSRVEVVIGDAFRFLRQSATMSEAIFVDFPYPTNYDLLKLFSVEFYAALRRNLTGTGFAIVDVPLWRDLEESEALPRPRPVDILYSTFRSAGFTNPFAFGPTDPFVFLTKEDRLVEFDYDRLPKFVSNQGLMNMTDLAHLMQDVEIRDEFVNSIFKPVPFRF